MSTEKSASVTIGIIGGSGLGALLGSAASDLQRHSVQTPFGPPSADILETSWNGLRVLMLSRHGDGHVFNPTQVPFRANIFALKMLGCTHIIASGAVGSLREEFKPRELVIPSQIIDKTHRRANTFFEKAAVHAEFAEPFDQSLRRTLLESAAESDGGAALTVHDRGCYVCMEGPAFSTRAESIMHRLWGGDLIGMTAMPEAKLAREAEIAYALVALVTDYDCWRQAPASQADAGPELDPFVLLEEIIGNLKAASENAMQLIRRAIAKIAAEPEKLADAPAHHALKLGIWTEKSKIERDEVERLRPLWGKYFDRGD